MPQPQDRRSATEASLRISAAQRAFTAQYDRLEPSIRGSSSIRRDGPQVQRTPRAFLCSQRAGSAARVVAAEDLRQRNNPSPRQEASRVEPHSNARSYDDDDNDETYPFPPLDLTRSYTSNQSNASAHGPTPISGAPVQRRMTRPRSNAIMQPVNTILSDDRNTRGGESHDSYDDRIRALAASMLEEANTLDEGYWVERRERAQSEVDDARERLASAVRAARGSDRFS